MLEPVQIDLLTAVSTTALSPATLWSAGIALATIMSGVITKLWNKIQENDRRNRDENKRTQTMLTEKLATCETHHDAVVEKYHTVSEQVAVMKRELEIVTSERSDIIALTQAVHKLVDGKS